MFMKNEKLQIISDQKEMHIKGGKNKQTNVMLERSDTMGQTDKQSREKYTEGLHK